MDRLADALYNDSDPSLHVDSEGVVHLDDDADTPDNSATIPQGSFAGQPLSEAEEMSSLADALYNGQTMTVDREGVVHLDDDASAADNGAVIPQGTFAGQPLSEAEEMSNLADALYNGQTMTVDRDGVVHLDDDASAADNGAVIPQGTFAAVMPSDPTQWYNKNDHRLFRTEVAAMKKFFPKAGFDFMKSTGNMYWVLDMNVASFATPWRFMLVYDKNHPHNNTFGGSIKVFPIRPNAADLKARATASGRPGVPHLLRSETLGTYLCTRRTEDVKDGTHEANTAVSVAAWAADWALHYELGLRDKKVWNKWCDDAHFRGLMV